MIWETVDAGIEEGNAVMAWASTDEAGYELAMWGLNRREIVDLDGMLVIANASDEAKTKAMIAEFSTPNPTRNDDLGQ